MSTSWADRIQAQRAELEASLAEQDEARREAERLKELRLQRGEAGLVQFSPETSSAAGAPGDAPYRALAPATRASAPTRALLVVARRCKDEDDDVIVYDVIEPPAAAARDAAAAFAGGAASSLARADVRYSELSRLDAELLSLIHI